MRQRAALSRGGDLGDRVFGFSSELFMGITNIFADWCFVRRCRTVPLPSWAFFLLPQDDGTTRVIT